MRVRTALPSSRATTFLQAKANAQMDCQVSVIRPGRPIFNPGTGMMASSAPVTVFTGPALIHASVGGVPTQIGDGIEVFRTFSVNIPATAPIIHREDLLKVTAGTDANLIGKALRVIDVIAGSPLVPSTRLICTDVEPGVFQP